jgi:hypothetical protein
MNYLKIISICNEIHYGNDVDIDKEKVNINQKVFSLLEYTKDEIGYKEILKENIVLIAEKLYGLMGEYIKQGLSYDIKRLKFNGDFQKDLKIHQKINEIGNCLYFCNITHINILVALKYLYAIAFELNVDIDAELTNVDISSLIDFIVLHSSNTSKEFYIENLKTMKM